MPVSRALLTIAVVLAAIAIVAWIGAGDSRPLAGDPGGATRPPAGASRAETGVRLAAGTNVRLVDRNSGHTLARFPVRLTDADQVEVIQAITGPEGELHIGEQCTYIESADGFAFERTSVLEATTDGTLVVSGRARIRVLGDATGVCQLAELAEQPKTGFSAGPGGLLLREISGIPIGDAWRLIPTRSGRYVLTHSDADLSPAHPIWAGRLVDSGEPGVQRLELPTKMRPAQVSTAFSIEAGAELEFRARAPSRNASIEYFLDREADKGVVELFRVDEVAGGSMITRLVEQRAVTAKDRSVRFDDVRPGQHILRSGLTLGDELRVSWQQRQLRAGDCTYALERAGAGSHVLHLQEWSDDHMMILLRMRSADGAMRQIGAAELRGVRRITGLHVHEGVINLARPGGTDVVRLTFDTTRSALLQPPR